MSVQKRDPFQNLMNLVLKKTGSAPVYNCLLYLHDPAKDFLYTHAVGNLDEELSPIAPHFRFRTGSITKPFTATLILQLMEEGVLDLDQPVWEQVKGETQSLLKDLLWVEGKNHSSSITIRHLLQHRSGLRDYFSEDERFFEQVSRFPHQNWSWQAVLEKYGEYGLHKKGVCKPGEGHHYADTNFLLLAVLVEELSQKAFHEVLAQRIMVPLGLRDTYLEFYQEAPGPLTTAYPYYGPQSLKAINTSFDWGGGGLVSTAHDLDVFVRALLAGKLFRQEATRKEMLSFKADVHDFVVEKRSTLYGLGLQRKILFSHPFFGHRSAYGAMLFYAPDIDVSIVVSLNQAKALHKAEWLMHKVLKEYLN